MELDRLEVRNFRGIRETFELEPDGGNVAIVGPNGSGKSSIIAAIDFLLNGSIESLSGEGTGGITAKEHAPHVDAEPANAWVEADFSLDGNTITVRRTLDAPSDPEFEAASEEVLQDYRAMEQSADRGLHLLSRDEILEFITSQGQTRSDRIRSLLDVNNVRDRRLVLRRAAKHYKDKTEQKEREIETIREGLADSIDVADLTESDLRAAVNELREMLGGNRLDTLEEGDFRHNIEAPSEHIRHSPVLSADGNQYRAELQDWLSEGIAEFLDADQQYRDTWAEIDPDEEAVRAAEHERLLELGQDAIDSDAEQCPLCQKSWDPDELHQQLDARLDEARELQEQKEKLDSRREAAQQRLTDIRLQIEGFIELVQQDNDFDAGPLQTYHATLSDWEQAYDQDLLAAPPKADLSRAERQAELEHPELGKLVERIDTLSESQPELDAAQDSWEQLIAIEDRYQQLQEARTLAQQYDHAHTQLQEVQEAYIDARDTVLGEIYTEIEEQFMDYYTALHDDESEFSADLSPTKAGLDLEVEFYGRGSHPPHALHSEGHQDSMGICLHFALCDWLQTEQNHPLVMLDDVVMSIDSQHRKPLAKLLADHLSDDFQLIITTHDDLWHRHLRSAGVVNSSNAIQFMEWDIQDGPKTMDKAEMEWETVYQLLDDGKVPSAAFQTRRMAEWFLREVCDQLDAKVRFDANSNWTLGDFKNSATSRFNELVGKAKQAEQSWGNDISHLNEIDDKASDVFRKLDEHGRALNPNVHWNETEHEFAHCGPEELRPAVEAYHDLYRLFWCENCGSCLSLSKQGPKVTGVRCRCQNTQWNLEKQ